MLAKFKKKLKNKMNLKTDSNQKEPTPTEIKNTENK